MSGAAIALGNFDGLHAGHRAVIADAGAAASRHRVGSSSLMRLRSG
jgi:FAD synthase